MSNQQSMFSPEESSHAQQERPYNDDPRERGSQQQFQGQPMGESGYEAGYQGYSGAYGQGEKLRPKPPSPQSGQIILFIVVILLIGGASGTLGSLFSALFGFLGGGLGLIIAAVIVVAAVSTRPVRLPTRTFAISEHAALSIHNDAGNVRILRGESSQVEVRATRYVSRLFGDMGVGEEPIYYSQEGDSISVNVRHWNFMRFLNVGYVSLEVLVPASSDVQTQSNAGTIDVTGISGRINASTNAGTIAVASAELAADSSLHTNAGTITIRQSTINDKARGHTNAGTITIVQSALKGGASFTTNAGTIHFNGSIAPNGDYIFKTNAGTIDAILPADSSFALTAHTSMGTVTNEFRSNLVGDGPYARLNLETPMGTITVRRQR